MNAHVHSDSAALFNARAVENNWPTRIDVTLSFQSKQLQAMRDLWNSIALGDRLPSRDQFTARLVKPFFKDLNLFGIEAAAGCERRYRHRYVGTNFAAIFGELTGLFFEDFMPPEALPRTIACFDTVVAGRCPVRVLTRFQLAKADYLAAEFFAAPLAEDGITPNMMLTVIHVVRPDQPDAEPWRLEQRPAQSVP